jgi:hypothetical protein
MTNPPTESSEPKQSITIKSGDMVNVIHRNIASDVIITTEDKVKICLLTHVANMEKKKDWIAPLGILITIIITLITTTFNSLYLGSAVWQAVFVMAAVLSGIWLIVTVYHALNAEKIEDIIMALKNQNSRVTASESPVME